MKEFNELVSILDRLLGPDGCPWDREQTLQSMRSSLLEETCEVIEAIDLNVNQHIEEELGDLFFNVIFLCKMAEKEGRFTMADALRHVAKKLIHRHPHVFGEAKIHNSDEVVKQWDEIKKQEKKQTQSDLKDGIPKDLPSLAQAQKIYKRMKKANKSYTVPQDREGQFGAALFDMVSQAQDQGLDAEQALRKFLALL